MAVEHRRQPARRPVAAGHRLRRAPIPGVAFNDFSPRLGFTYDLTGNGRTIAQGELRALLRPGRQRRRRRHDQPGRRRRRSAIRGPTLNSDQVRRRRRDHARARTPLLGQHQLVGGQSGEHRVGELGRSEPEERHHRRVHRRPRSRNRQGLRGRRELHLAEVRQLPVERSRQASRRPTGSPMTFTPTTGLPGRRRPPHRGARCPTVTYYEPTIPAADDHHAGERARLQPHVQRHRADRPQADVEPLDDEHQLRLQQHRRELRRLRRRGEPVDGTAEPSRSPRIRPTATCAKAGSTTT